MTISLVLRFAARDWRSGELRLVLAALLLAVGAVSAISLFVDRLQRALVFESASLLAADRVIDGGRAIPDRFRELAAAEGLAVVDVLRFPSMVSASASADGAGQLAAVKAVSPGYPLRGELRVADAPFGDSRVTAAVPARGEVWLNSRLFPALGIGVGDQVVVGVASFTVSAVIVGEPGQAGFGGGFAGVAPRLLMRAEDVPRTGVIQPGSRVQHRLALAGEAERLEALRAAIDGELAPGYRWRSVRDASATVGAALERAESFLLLGGLLAVLLAGIAVALGANRYARRHFDHVGVLKTLGATPKEIQWTYTGVLLTIGAAGALLGLVLGAAVHWAIIEGLRAYLPVNLPPPGPRPVYVGLVTGFVCLLAFALPPLLGLRKVSPMRVIRRDVAPGAAPLVTYGFGVAGGLGLLVWYSGDVWLTLWTLVGGVTVCGCFAALALLLLRGGRAVGMQAGSVWRLALAGLRRRHRENVAQIAIFGLAIMLLLIMVVVRTALIDRWRAELPEDTPNHGVMNVAPQDLDAVRALLKANAEDVGDFFPMVRARVATVNDTPAAEWPRQAPRAGENDCRNISGEHNLTVAAKLPRDNVVLAGRWWTDTPDELAVSLSSECADEWGVSVGDTLAFDAGGLPLVAKVTSVRRVNWGNMRLNFYIIFSPGALADLPATHMTSFRLPPEKKPFLNELLAAHPTIIVIEGDAIIKQVRRIVARVTQAVELVLYLVLAAGALVLVASIQSSRDLRLREHALLRALGGTRKLITGALVAEFALLGLFAGVIAAAGAEFTVSRLSSEIFDLDTGWHPWVWVAAPGFGALVIALVGYLGTRKLVSAPPIKVLREA